MAKIFICYRREDSDVAAGRIYDRLKAHFGDGHVFMDVDDIPLGVDFRAHLEQQIRDCNILIAVIGPRWLTLRDGQDRRRLEAPQDYVRTEIELALAREIPVSRCYSGAPPCRKQRSYRQASHPWFSKTRLRWIPARIFASTWTTSSVGWNTC